MARFIEIPETDDDLRFAAESIAKIAGDAISAIKDLYSRVPVSPVSLVSPVDRKISNQSGNQFKQFKHFETNFEIEDPRFAMRPAKTPEPPPPVEPVKLGFPETPREIKIDNALNNLQL